MATKTEHAIKQRNDDYKMIINLLFFQKHKGQDSLEEASLKSARFANSATL